MSAIPALGGSQRVWLALPQVASRLLGVSFHGAVVAVSVAAILLAFGAAFLRTWGAAYVGARVVVQADLNDNGVIADGPYRYIRNPLYLGTILHTVALGVLMSWAGAAFAVVSVVLLQFGLIASEESFLASRLGERYRAYRERVPSLFPGTPLKDSNFERHGADWPQAFLCETYMWGTAISFLLLGWRYDVVLVVQGILVSLGLSLVVRGFQRAR